MSNYSQLYGVVISIMQFVCCLSYIVVCQFVRVKHVQNTHRVCTRSISPFLQEYVPRRIGFDGRARAQPYARAVSAKKGAWRTLRANAPSRSTIVHMSFARSFNCNQEGE